MKSALITITLALLFTCLGVSPTKVHAAGALKLVIVIHADNEAKQADYPEDELRKIFLKQTTTWADKSEITPYQMSSGTKEADLFRKKILKKDAKALKKYWSDKRADEGISEPASKKKSNDIYKYVKKKKNNIGYMNNEHYEGLTEEEKKKIKVLRIIS